MVLALSFFFLQPILLPALQSYFWVPHLVQEKLGLSFGTGSLCPSATVSPSLHATFCLFPRLGLLSGPECRGSWLPAPGTFLALYLGPVGLLFCPSNSSFWQACHKRKPCFHVRPSEKLGSSNSQLSLARLDCNHSKQISPKCCSKSDLLGFNRIRVGGLNRIWKKNISRVFCWATEQMGSQSLNKV